MKSQTFKKITNSNLKKTISIGGSKSLSNRILLLNHLYFDNKISLVNLSDADDTKHFVNAISSKENKIYVGLAGTTLRFLTAYYSTKENSEIEIYGEKRLHERPIHILVNTLNEIGCDISYLENDKFPPLKILGKKIKKSSISIDSNISSQYITALMMVAPTFENGLKITFNHKPVSIPYIKMTLAQMESLGFETELDLEKNTLSIPPLKNENKLNKPESITIESDWSSISYWYSFVALSQNLKLDCTCYFQKSIQGDYAISQIFEKYFGVKSTFTENQNLCLEKIADFTLPQKITLNLNDTPDLAQTVAVCAFAMGVRITLTGLETLLVKETNRILALKIELQKLGANVIDTPNSIEISGNLDTQNEVQIETYHDHRMAMAFAPITLLRELTILDPEVVNKSYPKFWKDYQKVFNK